MKILFVHNLYLQRGGEDSVLRAEVDLLQSNGHSIEIYSRHNREISYMSRLRLFFDTSWSKRSAEEVLGVIRSFEPDIVHVHNFFPLITPSIYDVCIDEGVPVVQTLHNYRTICPGALLMRSGEICEKCVTGSPYHAVLHRCYRNSFFASLAVARMVDYHRKKLTWINKVDRFIALTHFGKRKFVEAGFPAEKLVVKPNFYCEQSGGQGRKLAHRSNALFVGRLSEEKGVAVMLDAWQSLDIPLRVVGSGPLFDDVVGYGLTNVEFLGDLPAKQVSQQMDCASFVVIPSGCYEGFPVVLVEAFAHSLPVIASKQGAMAEMVQDGVTGLLFDRGNAQDLVQKVQWMFDHPVERNLMGEKARQVYEEKYTSATNYLILMDIYREVLKGKAVRRV